MLCSRVNSMKRVNAARCLVKMRSRSKHAPDKVTRTVTELLEQTLMATTSVALRPVIDILKSIDSRLERIEQQHGVERPDKEYVAMVELHEPTNKK